MPLHTLRQLATKFRGFKCLWLRWVKPKEDQDDEEVLSSGVSISPVAEVSPSQIVDPTLFLS